MAKYIVWTTNRDNVVSAALKQSKRAAVMAYNKLGGDPEIKEYGWSISDSAGPAERRAVGLKPFLDLGERD